VLPNQPEDRIPEDVPSGDGTPQGMSEAGMSEAGISEPGMSERLAVLETLTQRPLPEHAEVFEALHADLQAALAEIDSA
jgi:hypothetical protein